MNRENSTPKHIINTRDIFLVQRCNSCEEVILHSAILFSSSTQSACEICDFPQLPQITQPFSL